MIESKEFSKRQKELIMLYSELEELSTTKKVESELGETCKEPFLIPIYRVKSDKGWLVIEGRSERWGNHDDSTGLVEWGDAEFERENCDIEAWIIEETCSYE